MWNDYLRAVNRAGLKLSTLKLTLLVNSGRGPYHSGRNQFTIEKATADLLSKVSDDYLASLAEAVWRDGGCVGQCPARVSPEEWMEARGIRTRLKEAGCGRVQRHMKMPTQMQQGQQAQQQEQHSNSNNNSKKTKATTATTPATATTPEANINCQH